ncbi:MAG: hypothetical protein M3373_06115 [Gemmatimonadota bacterium]|nr:hypothetical protein [Gemmatimonadota bacterium]
MSLALDPALRDAVSALQTRIAEQLPVADPLGRIAGRAMTIEPIDTHTVEVTFRGVPQLSEAEVRAFRKVAELQAFCTVAPESATTLAVTFICKIA